MKTNEGAIDRILRIALGIALLSLAFVGPHTPWAIVGVVPLATGIAGFCPLYRLIGIETCRVAKRAA